jgi:vacuolar-type H+-ATPase subunit E/Vma4
MALEDIIDRIKEDAADAVSRIKKETDEGINQIIEECDDECDVIEKQAREEGEKLASEERSRIIIQANLTGKKEQLAGRTGLVNEAFAKVREGMYSDLETYRRFLVGRIFEATGDGSEKVIFSSGDHDRFGEDLQAIVAEVNQKLFDENRKGELVLTNEKGDFEAGFVLRRGRARTIMTLDTVVNDLRDRYEPDVGRILSGDNA